MSTRADLNPDLFAAARLRSLTFLYPGILHELRGPLNVISLNLDLLEAAEGLPDDLREHVDTIEREFRKLNAGLAKLSARFGPDEPAPNAAHGVDLGELLGALAAVLQPQARAQRIALRVAAERGARVTVPPAELEQAILAVLINALEAAEREVSVTVAEEESADGREVRLSIADDGPGIPAGTDPERLFERDFTTKGRGTGLGLYVADHIITAHDGTLWPGSRPAGGVEFSIRLPAVQKAPTAAFS